MKIGIIGAGNIGATLARKLVASGHEVKDRVSGSGVADGVGRRSSPAGPD